MAIPAFASRSFAPLPVQLPLDVQHAGSMRLPISPSINSSSRQEPSAQPQEDHTVVKVEWTSKKHAQQRREVFGLRGPEVDAFVTSTEFVSLGCFCGVGRALQCLDVKQNTYTFDWARSDVPAVINCLRRDFQDFTSYAFTAPSPAGGLYYGGSSWGGSFWHHDVSDQKVKDDFRRRIDRLAGRGKVPGDLARVFCISLNALDNIFHISTLYDLLQEMLPEAEVYLLVFIDNQPFKGSVCTIEQGERILFYTTNEDMFQQNGKDWSEQRQAEAYAEGLALAIRAWAGVEEAWKRIHQIETVAALAGMCKNFHGGDASSALYWPRRIEEPVQGAVQSSALIAKEGKLHGMAFVRPSSYNALSIPAVLESLGDTWLTQIKSYNQWFQSYDKWSSQLFTGVNVPPTYSRPIPIRNVRTVCA